MDSVAEKINQLLRELDALAERNKKLTKLEALVRKAQTKAAAVRSAHQAWQRDLYNNDLFRTLEKALDELTQAVKETKAYTDTI